MMKKIPQLKKINSTLFYIITAGIVAILLSRINLYLEVISVYLAYRLLKDRLKLHLSSRFLYMVLAVLTVAALHQVVIVLSWAIFRETPLTFIPPIVTASMTLWAFIAYRVKKSASTIKLPTITSTDITALIVSFTAIIAIVIGAFVAKPGVYGASALQLINGNVDDASHLSMLNDKLQFNRGISYHTESAGSLRGNTRYPNTWHAYNAIIAQSLIPNLSLSSGTLLYYAFSKMCWFFVLLFLLTRASLSIYQQLSKRKNASILQDLTCLPILYLPIFVVAVPIFQLGFYSFIPQIIYALAALTILTLIVKKNLFMLACISILLCASTLSWTLVMPSALLMIFYLGFKNFDIKKIPKISTLNPSHLTNILFITGPIVAAFLQYYIISQDKSDGSTSALESLLFDGGIIRYTGVFLFVLFIILLTGFYLLKKHRTILNDYTMLLFSVLLPLTGLYLIQQALTNSNPYYYHKMLLILIFLAMPLIIATSLYYSRIIEMQSKLNTLVINSAVAFIFILSFGLDPVQSRHTITLLSYMQGKRTTSAEDNELLYQAIKMTSSLNHYNNKEVVIIHDPRNLDFSQIHTHFLKAGKPNSHCFNQLNLAYATKTNIDDHYNVLTSACSNNNVTVITTDTYKDQLKERYGLIKNTSFVSYQEYVASKGHL